MKRQQLDIIDNFLKDFGLRRGDAVADGLALVGSRLTGSRLDGVDEEVITSLSNEIVRFRQKKPGNLLPSQSGTWQLSSETNRKIVEDKISSILSLNLEPEARKIIL